MQTCEWRGGGLPYGGRWPYMASPLPRRPNELPFVIMLRKLGEPLRTVRWSLNLIQKSLPLAPSSMCAHATKEGGKHLQQAPSASPQRDICQSAVASSTSSLPNPNPNANPRLLGQMPAAKIPFTRSKPFVHQGRRAHFRLYAARQQIQQNLKHRTVIQ